MPRGASVWTSDVPRERARAQVDSASRDNVKPFFFFFTFVAMLFSFSPLFVLGYHTILQRNRGNPQ